MPLARDQEHRLDLRCHQLDPFVQREHRPLAGADCDTNHQLVQKTSGTGNHIEMAVGDRIEGSRIQSDTQFFHRLSHSGSSSGAVSGTPFSSLTASITGNTLVTCSPAITRNKVTPIAWRPVTRT